MRNVALQIVTPGARVLDVGSMIAEPGQLNYRPIFKDCTYLGLDMVPGTNVDIVPEDPYKFPLEPESFDLVISGQTFEHVEFPWLTIQEISRVMKPGAHAILIAPSSGPEHRYPQDCYRYYPDGMKALAKWAGLDCLHTSTDWFEAKVFEWGDTLGVFQKPGGLRKRIDYSNVRDKRSTLNRWEMAARVACSALFRT